MRFDAGIRLVELGIELLEHPDPHLDVFALRLAYLSTRVGRQAFEVAVLDADQVRLAQCEVEVELHQCVECGAR
ncbi:Uncharacterised protein [Mycobacteroides abscessus subsp. abscessus]|nr:Uncharacterised protein [Mycobacteroides abscessus subsp. abscessus]